MYVLIPVYYAASCGEYNPKRDLSSFLNFNYDSEDMLVLWLVGDRQFLQKIKQSRYDSLKSRIRICHELKQIEGFEEFKSFIEFGFKKLVKHK